MIQIKVCNDEQEVNNWLEKYSEQYEIIDIKFGYCATNSWTHMKYIIIYEKKRQVGYTLDQMNYIATKFSEPRNVEVAP